MGVIMQESHNIKRYVITILKMFISKGIHECDKTKSYLLK